MRAKETAEIVDKGSRLCCFHHRLSISPRSSSRAEPPSSGRAVRVAIWLIRDDGRALLQGEVKIQAELLYRRKRGIDEAFPRPGEQSARKAIIESPNRVSFPMVIF